MISKHRRFLVQESYLGRFDCIYISRGGGGGVLRISSDGVDGRIFLGLKFSIPGVFWVGKIAKYFFVWLDLSRDFLGI